MSAQNHLKKLAKSLLAISGYELLPVSYAKYLKDLDDPVARLLAVLTDQQRGLCLPCIPHSKSQLAQDLFVVSLMAERNLPPYFIEFGATDGVSLSNTHLLEQSFGWQGLLAEPAKIWHEMLKRNRSCHIDFRCVSDTTGSSIEFLEVDYPELSGIKLYADSGDWASSRRLANSSTYMVDTVSFNDLLDSHQVPGEVGYLSIDTEGSELSILQSFDFGKRKIHAITIEHNYVEPQRTLISRILSDQGYIRTFANVSLWDDWYVLPFR